MVLILTISEHKKLDIYYDFLRPCFFGTVCFSTTLLAIKDLIVNNMYVYIPVCFFLYFFSYIFSFEKGPFWEKAVSHKMIISILYFIICIVVAFSVVWDRII